MQVRFSLGSDPVTVTVSGTVVDQATGEPIPGALVRGHVVAWVYHGPDLFEQCPHAQTLTDEKGRYTLEIQTPLTTAGPFKGRDGLCLYASAPGFETLPQYARPDVSSEKTEYTDFDFALAAGHRISGTLVDPHGQPVAGALVRVQNGLNGDWNFFGALGMTTTNEQGRFELWMSSKPTRNLTRKPWLVIFKSGQGGMLVWDLLDKSDLGTLTLPVCGSISGRVIDGRGEPLSNCEVSVRGGIWDLIARTETDAEGRYVLTGVPGDPGIAGFYMWRHGQFDDTCGVVEVHARLNSQVELKNAASYKLQTRDGETVVADDVVISEDTTVSGKLIPSAGSLGLGGLMVRLDTGWENMVEVDVEGNFLFPCVAAGQHKLTAYLPHNLRYDRGIGRTTIEVTPGVPVTDVEIQLDDLAELRVQYLDAKGNPLAGISGSATWSQDGSGAWTEGTVSDTDGWAVLYLYPGDSQHVGGFDRSRRFVTETRIKVAPAPAQIMEAKQIVMIESAALTGRLLDEMDAPVADKRFTCLLAYANGSVTRRWVQTDENGQLMLPRLVPGVVELTLEDESVLYRDVLDGAFEIEPGQALGLGDIRLRSGIDKAAAVEAMFDRVVAEPAKLLAAAKQLIEAVRDADYTQPEAWRDFIEPEYCVYTNYPAWVQWVCTHLKDNPITTIELGDVSRSQVDGFWAGHVNVPAVSYKLTLQDGRVIEGVLHFDYSLDGQYWMGMYGLDWHLNDPLQ